MINDRRCQPALVSAVRAACDIGYAAEQSLFRLGVLRDVKELLDIGRDRLATAGTCNLCLRHLLFPISNFRFTIDGASSAFLALARHSAQRERQSTIELSNHQT